MARHYARSSPMNEFIKLRATAKDKAEVALKAQELGMDSSAYIRYILIQQKIIQPL